MARRVAGLLMVVALLAVSSAAWGADHEGHFGAVGDYGISAWPSDVTWDGLTIGWTGRDSVGGESIAEYVVMYRIGDAGSWRTICRFDGPGAGESYACYMSDKSLAGRRAVYRVEALSGDGDVLGWSQFEIVHAVHVELGKYSLGVLRDMLEGLMAALWVPGESGPGRQRWESAVNRLRDWGPFGVVRQAGDTYRNHFQERASGGQSFTYSELEDELFTFRWQNRFTGWSYEFVLIPVSVIYENEAWDTVWRVIEAACWALFFFWLLKRVAPQTGVG